MKRKITYALLTLLLGAMLLPACKEENETTLSRLFMPEFVPASYDIQGTSIKYVWRRTTSAATYVIELSEQEDFSTILLRGETSSAHYTFTGLKFFTPYWARIKAVSANPETGESKWNPADRVVTLTRDIPNLLYEVAGEDIEMKAVVLRWNVEMLAENPVDRLVVSQVNGDKSTVIRTIDLTQEQALAGNIRIEELTRNTTYSATLYNMQAPEGNQHYNTRTFKTAGAPDGAISVEANDDLFRMMTEALADEQTTEVIFYLTAGASYYMMETANMEQDPETLVWKPIAGRGFGSPLLSKSITFTAEPGARPTLYVKGGKWDFPTTATVIDKISVNGVNIKEYISTDFPSNNGCYLFNVISRSNNLTIKELSFSNCDIDLPRSLWLMNGANNPTTTVTRIEKFIMDGCTYTATSGGASGYGVFQGSAAGSDIFNDIQITNSTFYGSPSQRGLFHRPTAAIATENGKIRVENCTFYNFATTTTSSPVKGSGFPLIDLQSLTKNLNVTVKGCLFANQIAGIVRMHANNAGEFIHEANYYTTDAAGNNGNGSVTSSLKGYIDNMTAVGLSSGELFADPANGDFTIKDKSSIVYTQRIGDPKWIK